MAMCEGVHLPNKPRSHRRVWPFGWIIFPRRKPSPDCAALEAELVRLAKSAPHLLTDIGFQVDPRRSNSVRTVWVSPKDGLVFEQPEPAAVRRAG